MIRKNRLNRFTISAIAVLLILSASVTASAQEDISDFSQTFQVFMQSRDAYRVYDLSPDDVIYELPPTYEIGPGDILQVVLTGMVNDALVVQVGPQGDIFVPPAGLLDVNGLTVDAAREIVDKELSEYLINYECDIQLMSARRIRVYLLGQVRQPGQYIAVAGTTTISLIQTAGSIVVNPAVYPFDETAVAHPYFRALTSGAGRFIDVYRDNELVATMDIAKVAINGQVQDDFILQDGDALYIRPNYNPVVIRGGVARPGTYEVTEDDTIFDLIAQSGGYVSLAMLGDINIERDNPIDAEFPTTTYTLHCADPDFDPAEFTFEPGDLIRVPEQVNSVYVLGAVWMPQAVEYREGWNALDYIAQTGGPTSPSDHSSIRIISFPMSGEQNDTEWSFKNLYLGESVENVPIEPGDLIWVPWKNQPFYGPGMTNTLSVFLGQTVSLLNLIDNLQD